MRAAVQERGAPRVYPASAYDTASRGVPRMMLWTKSITLLLLVAMAWPESARAQGAAASFEFRGSTRGRQSYVDHIWRLRADGRISGQSTERRGGGLGGYAIELADTGSWQIRGGQICIAWDGAFRALSGCYSVERRQGSHVALSGPSSFEGELDPMPRLQ
jgi:hypothetical protein